MELTPKPDKEIQDLLDGVDSVVLLACKSCFKEFVSDESDAMDSLQETISAAGKRIVRAEEGDFLCLQRTTSDLMEELDLDEVDAVAVYACGVGTQTVAGLTDKLVLPMGNAEGYRFFGGFYPTDSRLCAACGECVLNDTAGICPVAYCSKGLVNGPCGGAQDGKCEIDEEKDCVWMKIYDRLKEQGRLESMRAGSRMPDYSRADFAEQAEAVEEVQQRRDESFPGGVHPLEEKEATAGETIQDVPVPKMLVVPLSQHIGQQCAPTVEPGDSVKLGQVIGESEAFISAPVHSPVSGTVLAVEERPHPVISTEVLSVIIENDGQDTPDESIRPIEDIDSLSVEQIVDIVCEKGITGMGGAMFPTHVKLQPKDPVDVLILNGCECEPYLTADHRMMLEEPDKILGGLRLIARALGVERCIVAIEENKPDAIELLRENAGEDIEVKSLPTKYPQGAERMLVKALTGRDVPRGGLPIDVGAVVSNVGTAAAVYEAVAEGMPLIERVMTVSGPAVDKPGNYRVRIGTSFSELLAGCLDGAPVQAEVVKMGGPMMGVAQHSLDVPVIKGTTGITILPEPDIPTDEERACVRCGRCMEVCPMDLKPHQLFHYIKEEDWDKLAELNLNDCIECGACEYICSSKLPLVSMIQKAKEKTRTVGAK